MITIRSVLALCFLAIAICPTANADELSEDQMKAVLDLEQKRITAIDRVIGSVVAIYGNDRSGGGSGVIIHPSGIALTNHHVIMGAGVEGWGGIADGKMYKWKLIGTDPGRTPLTLATGLWRWEIRLSLPKTKLRQSPWALSAA